MPVEVFLLIKIILKLPQTGRSPGNFFARQDKTTETSHNSGKSPGKKLTRLAISNQQLADTPQGYHITEESLRSERPLEVLGESTHHTKDIVFAKEIAAYGRPRDGATRCPTHLDFAPPPVAVGKGTTNWLSQSAVRSALRLKKVGLPNLIASVREEPDIHSAVGTLPHEEAPLLDQMRLNGTPVKIYGPPLSPKQLAAAMRMGRTTLITETPHFYL